MSIPDIHIWHQVFDLHRAEFSQKLDTLLARHEDVMTNAALGSAALIADKVEATAKPGDGKDTAAEIGRRIRALMEGTR